MAQISVDMDTNPLVEFVDEAEDFVMLLNRTAQKIIDYIAVLPADAQAPMKNVLAGATSLLEATRVLETFDFSTDSEQASPPRGADQHWINIMILMSELRGQILTMTNSWTPEDLPADFVAYFQTFSDLFDEEINARRRAFRESHVWIFMNYFRPYNPFFTRLPSGLYIVQSYDKFKQSFDMGSIALYFMVSLYAY